MFLKSVEAERKRRKDKRVEEKEKETPVTKRRMIAEEKEEKMDESEWRTSHVNKNCAKSITCPPSSPREDSGPIEVQSNPLRFQDELNKGNGEEEKLVCIAKRKQMPINRLKNRELRKTYTTNGKNKLFFSVIKHF